MSEREKSTVKQGSYWCCAADFGQHETSCKNYVGPAPAGERELREQVEELRDSITIDWDKEPEDSCIEKRGQKSAYETVLNLLAALSSSTPEPLQREQRNLCENCHNPVNQEWLTENPIWLIVTGHTYGHWCIPCFDKAASKLGIILFWQAEISLHTLEEIKSEGHPLKEWSENFNKTQGIKAGKLERAVVEARLEEHELTCGVCRLPQESLHPALRCERRKSLESAILVVGSEQGAKQP